MAASTLVLKGDTIADIVTTGGDSLDLVGVTTEGAIYRYSSFALATPWQVEFRYQIGAPGAKGNDKLFVISSLSRANSTTKVVSTLTAKIELSVPRDSATFTDADTKNALAWLASVAGQSAFRAAIADGRVV